MFEELLEKIKEYKIAAGLILLGLGIAGFVFFRGGGANREEHQVSALAQEVLSSSTSASRTVSQSQETESGEENSELTVDVKGAVKNPGVYQLKKGSRVYDVLQKAGGLAADADSKSINQAQKLTDEAVVYVARVGEEGVDVTAGAALAGNSSAGTASSSSLVNLNTATEADLQTISGIGQKRAQDIIAYREANGGFQSVEDLKNVSGIGDKTLEKLKDYVTVD